MAHFLWLTFWLTFWLIFDFGSFFGSNMRVAREGGSGSVSTSVSPHGSPLRLQRPICVISTLRVHQRRFIMALSACKRAMAPFISPWLLAPRRLYLVPNITRYYSKSSHKYHHLTRMGKLLRQASFNTLLSRIFHQSSRSFHLSISCVHRCTNRVTLHAAAASSDAAFWRRADMSTP